MKKVYIVFCETHSLVLGVYSESSNAINCKAYFDDKFPNDTNVIFSEVLDLVEY